jgi:uncharacterized membrane protein
VNHRWLLVDAGIAVVAAVLVLILAPGLAIVAIIVAAVLAVCLISFPVGWVARSRRAARERRRHRADRRHRVSAPRS